jgi:4-hydroxy-tetrahydrodipicolinate reductase
MKIAIIGYGRMGQEIERLAEKRGHEVVMIIDSESDWQASGGQMKEADVAFEFSTPQTAVDNIYRCFDAGVPVVTGTTGWFEDLGDVKKTCAERGQAMFWSANFSIGVNLYFDLNRYLAKLMSDREEYDISIEETHHILKQDAPSGTAIILANDIIQNIGRLEKWVKEMPGNPEELGIKSVRTENVPGTHVVKYESENDLIEIIHTAKNRRGFATGALMAAEWLAGKKGYYEMKDMIFRNI